MEDANTAGVLSYDSSNQISVVNTSTAIQSASVYVNNSSAEGHSTKNANMYRIKGDTEHVSSLMPYITVYMWKRTG